MQGKEVNLKSMILHNLTWTCYDNEKPCFDGDFVSQIKLTELSLIRRFDITVYEGPFLMLTRRIKI